MIIIIIITIIIMLITMIIIIILKFHFFTLIKGKNIFKPHIAVTTSDKNLDLLNMIKKWSTHLKKVNCWKKKSNCREILSKTAGLKRATCNLLKNELLHRYVPVTLTPSLTLSTFCVVPIWKTQHELSRATFVTTSPRISEAAQINFNAL